MRIQEAIHCKTETACVHIKQWRTFVHAYLDKSLILPTRIDVNIWIWCLLLDQHYYISTVTGYSYTLNETMIDPAQHLRVDHTASSRVCDGLLLTYTSCSVY